MAVTRLGTGDDIAAAVAYVTSDEAGFLTGQVICVDGGMTDVLTCVPPRSERCGYAAATISVSCFVITPAMKASLRGHAASMRNRRVRSSIAILSR